MSKESAEEKVVNLYEPIVKDWGVQPTWDMFASALVLVIFATVISVMMYSVIVTIST